MNTTMKRYFTSGMTGILIGLAISITVSLFTTPSYMPLNPYSAVGTWMQSQNIHESLVMTYCAVIWFAIGLLFEAGNRFFRMNWSPLRATLTHYALMLLGFIPLAILGGWFPTSLSFILSLIVEFTIIYLVVWTISYQVQKRKIQEINETLGHR